ncbi:MAG: hypothetical protein GEV03_04330 [Streptosporangiales bacterium]|nr:hypothetical protein [Streptosporangiales bacterium]
MVTPPGKGWAKAPDYSGRAETRAALEATTAADRREYLESGFRPVECVSCGSRVLVKKNSLEHTSVQWISDAATGCPEFAARLAAGAPDPSTKGTAHIESCPKLRESIDRAVREGLLEVPGRDV